MNALSIYLNLINPLIKDKVASDQVEVLIAMIIGILIGHEATAKEIKNISKQIKKLNRNT